MAQQFISLVSQGKWFEAIDLDSDIHSISESLKSHRGPMENGDGGMVPEGTVLSQLERFIGYLDSTRVKLEKKRGAQAVGQKPLASLSPNNMILDNTGPQATSVTRYNTAGQKVNELGEPLGGIDLNSANLNLQIKRDGKGVPLPIGQQDLDHINLQGLIPVIFKITPVTNLPVLSELQQKIQPQTLASSL